MVFGRHKVELKSYDEILVMRAAGLVVAQALEAVRERVRPGVTTRELDAVAAQVIHEAGAKPSFLGYHGYPASICTSVNEEVVHGIPSDRVLVEGDLLSVDCGANIDGWHGDAAISIPVGIVGPDVAELSRATEDSLWAGIAAVRAGMHATDVGEAVEASVMQSGAGRYGIVEDYVGHGIGSAMHQYPDVPNYGRRSRGAKLRTGAAIAIEPMITLGSPLVEVQDDDWTVSTLSGGFAAHWEHTVAVLEDGPWVLTAPDGGVERLAKLGVAAHRPQRMS